MSRVALVIGINNYRYEGLQNLSAPADDAEAIAQRLEKHGNFTVIRLPEAIDRDTKKPFVGKSERSLLTLTKLQDALVNLFCPDSKQVPDTALLYFSGHGLLQTRGVREGFLATSDTDPRVGMNGLSLRWLRELLQTSSIKQQIIWLDCCHSGAILNVSDANPGESGNARDRCFIAASRDFEKSYQALGSPYSVLTKALIDGLDSHQTSLKGLDNYDLTNFIKNELSSEIQRPTFSNFGEPIGLIQRWEKDREKEPEVSIDVKCPYKGLAFFDDNETDPQFFFGRSQLTNLLLDRVRQNNCLVLLGASGSGKSSVLRAGVLNQLRLGRKLSGSDRWKIQTIVPGEHPLKSLAESFVDPALSNIERASQLNNAQNLLKDANGLYHLVETSDAPCLVLVIDQFEESFTLCQDMLERQQFFNNLIGAIASHNDKFRLVIAMRADFFGKCVEHEYGGLAKQLEAHLVAITPMVEAELREAITKPAQLVGCEVEPLLIEEIVRDVAGSPANLPLMQFALSELWNYREGNKLTLNAYKQEFGGISGALEKRANAVYESFSEPEKKAVKHIFVLLTRLGERNEEDTRRRVGLTSLVTPMFPLDVINRVVKKLADEKLVVTNKSILPDNNEVYEDSVNETSMVTTAIILSRKDKEMRDMAIVEVAHEALIRSWSKMREWLEENREMFRQEQKLNDRAEEWERANKSKGFLLQGRPLQDASEFVKIQKKSGNNTLASLAIDFVKASEKKRHGDRLKLTSIFLVFPFIGSLIAVHFYLLNLAKTVLSINNCETRSEVRLLLEYKLLIGHREQLDKIKLCNQNLNGIQLQRSSLEEVDFRRAILANSNFQDAFLEKSDFSGAYLGEVNFKGAYLKNAKFEDSDLYRAKMKDSKDLTESQLKNSKLCETELPINLKLISNRNCENRNR